jgi:hypothetical protein
VSGVTLTAVEEEAVYVLLKPLEQEIAAPLDGLLHRVEQALFDRLTIEQIERLAARFGRGR